jgi:hypothetical protein
MNLLEDKNIEAIITDLDIAKSIMEQLVCNCAVGTIRHIDRSHNNVDEMAEKLGDILISLDDATRETKKMAKELNYYKQLIKEVRTETLIREGAKNK